MNTLITGASSGIGKALAIEFAKHKHNVILVARNEEALSELANILTHEHGIKAYVIAKDLSEINAAEYVQKKVHAFGLDVEVLVNNAGYGVHGRFLKSDLTTELDLIQLQLSTFVSLTKLFLKPMCQRKKGYLLNIASVYSFSPVPYQSIYGACKAFMTSFSEAIAAETKSEGISVTLVYPGSTRTNFRARAGVKSNKAKVSGMPAEIVAAQAYKGMIAGQRSVIPGFANKLFCFACMFMPNRWRAGLIERINRVRLKGKD